MSKPTHHWKFTLDERLPDGRPGNTLTLAGTTDMVKVPQPDGGYRWEWHATDSCGHSGTGQSPAESVANLINRIYGAATGSLKDDES